jgi:hypothetical protein
MSGRQLSTASSRIPAQTVPLGIRDIYHYPFAVTRFKRILHGHAAVYGSIASGMEGNCGVGFVFIERDRCGCKRQALQV